MTTRVTPQIGSDGTRQWFGVYEGRVVSSRAVDLYIRAQVPQVLGQAITDWAPPLLDPRMGTQYGSYGINITSLPPGPGPGAGSRVAVMFLGGDINHPCYCLLGIHS